jgi:hypothetical protein
LVEHLRELISELSKLAGEPAQLGECVEENAGKPKPGWLLLCWLGETEPGGDSPTGLSLRYPDFLSRLVALTNLMRLSLRKAAHAAMSSAAWQEIRVRSGRDDKFKGGGPP